MNLTFLHYFLAVAEAGHFTRAAERLNVTQPTLSAGIARLEDALGTRLFDRQRRVALTAAGNRLLPQARAITEAWASARADLRQMPTSRRPLRLGVLPTLPDRVVLALTTRLAGRTIELIEANGETLQTRLQRNQLDAALKILPTTGPAQHVRALHREAYVVAVPPGHPLAGRSRATVTDFAATPFVLRLHCEAHTEARRLFAAHHARPPVAARTVSDGRALALVAAGVGACLMPESLVDTSVGTVAVSELRLERRLGLVLRAGLDADLAEGLHDAARALPWGLPRPVTVIAH